MVYYFQCQLALLWICKQEKSVKIADIFDDLKTEIIAYFLTVSHRKKDLKKHKNEKC